jgi:hypothetical protein
MRKIGLARERAQCGELRRREADEVELPRVHVRHALEHGGIGRRRHGRRRAELAQTGVGRSTLALTDHASGD